MPHLVAAPDKFRGTASAADIASAAGRAASLAGWSCDPIPLSDGGEGFLSVFGGREMSSQVAGPLGEQTSAQWRLLESSSELPTAVIEMAQAAGRLLLANPHGDESTTATTRGVGELIAHAIDAGAGRILVGCGGSATTDGGWGAFQVLRDHPGLHRVDLVAAVDVTTGFNEAAVLFGPQKGASPDQVRALNDRLALLATRYLEEVGVDVTEVAGAGAAGGLAGGLLAAGGRIEPGFQLVAHWVDLPQRLVNADLVMTGEGFLDASSMAGKVVGEVIDLAGTLPVLCVVGGEDPGVRDQLPAGVEVVSLSEHYGPEGSRSHTSELVQAAIADALARR